MTFGMHNMMYLRQPSFVFWTTFFCLLQPAKAPCTLTNLKYTNIGTNKLLKPL